MIPHSKPCIGQEEIEAVARVLHTGRIAQGAEVEAFEAECAAFAGRGHAVAVNSGTAALHLALLALGIRQDDPVAFPSYACAALAQAVAWQGAKPVLCDIGHDYNLAPAAVPAGVRAIIVPHLFGAPAALPVHENLIEDVAQSFGGPTGRVAKVAMTSFYATKLLTTGEGGMLLTDDAALAEEARDRRDYDNRDDFKVRYAYKMTDFQAAMGRVQLKRLKEFIRIRREIAQQYREAFQALPLRIPNHPDHVYFRYVVATARRDALEAFLQEHGIEAKRPIHRPAHHSLGGAFPETEKAHHECLSIPIYPAMTSQEVRNVIEWIVKFCDLSSDKQIN